MLLVYSVKSAVVALKRNKSRSVLTVLGIVIGITAIILVMSLGQGAQNLILAQIQGIGAKTIAVLPGRHPKGPADIAQTLGDSLKERDLELLRRKSNAPTLAVIEPIVFGAASIAYKNETYQATVFGVTNFVEGIYKLEFSEGAFLSEADSKQTANVVVLGSKIKEELFGSSDAVGEKVRIKNRNYRIIGVLESKGQSFINFDEAIMAPYTTVQQYMLGIRYFHRLVGEADKEENVERTVGDIKATLRAAHGITDPEKDDFNVETQADALKTVGSITNILKLFLIAMAAISLVVGGVGIMNIMLVAVTERTREIGLRKALGATKSNILIQFLLEAVILTGLGGLIGISFGAGLSFIVSLVLSRVANLAWMFTLPVSAILLGLGVSSLVGLIFGLYPARQASLKSPMEALRYE